MRLTELSNGKKVDSRIYPSLQEMSDEARAEGVYPIVREGYRTEEEQRRRVILYFFGGLTYEQIGKKEGCTKMPVKRSIDAALERLKKELKKF